MSTKVFYKKENISVLRGRTLASIEGLKKDGESVTFICEDGAKFVMHHLQDCCESVTIDDIIGDVGDLIGSPIVIAEIVTNKDIPAKDEHAISYTWTFYKLATQNGYVDIRWYGESNGYYSEDVDFERVIENNKQLFRGVIDAVLNIEHALYYINEEKSVSALRDALHALNLVLDVMRCNQKN